MFRLAWSARRYRRVCRKPLYDGRTVRSDRSRACDDATSMLNEYMCGCRICSCNQQWRHGSARPASFHLRLCASAERISSLTRSSRRRRLRGKTTGGGEGVNLSLAACSDRITCHSRQIHVHGPSKQTSIAGGKWSRGRCRWLSQILKLRTFINNGYCRSRQQNIVSHSVR